jgi:hypothetical protein
VTPAAAEYAIAVRHALRDARDELRSDDFRLLLEAVTATVAELISESWDHDPDRPGGWS